MRAHEFTPTTEHDDHECSTCKVRRAPRVQLSLPCPAGDCSAATNPDRGCVFVRARDGHGCVCCYCGRPGGFSTAADDEDVDDFELVGA